MGSEQYKYDFIKFNTNTFEHIQTKTTQNNMQQ